MVSAPAVVRQDQDQQAGGRREADERRREPGDGVRVPAERRAALRSRLVLSQPVSGARLPHGRKRPATLALPFSQKQQNTRVKFSVTQSLTVSQTSQLISTATPTPTADVSQLNSHCISTAAAGTQSALARLRLADADNTETPLKRTND